MIQETYPSGRVVKNEFESDGDLQRIYGQANATAPERTYANGFTYTPDSRIEKLKLGNGLWESARFNTRLQVTELALGHSVGDGSLWKLNYDYGEIDSNGNVDIAKNTGNIARQTLSFNGLTNPLVQNYKYDSLYRLTEAKETAGANQTWKQQFGYDRYGNRLTHNKFVGTTPITLDNRSHPTIDPLTNRFNPNQGFGYDKNGNLTADAEGRSFTFNGDNKQTVVMNGSLKIGEYFYDGEGKRVKKKAYDATGVLKEETIFVYSAGKLIAEYSTEPPQNPTINYTATDQLGSPRVITDGFGQVKSRRDFQPFGEEVINNIGERPTNLKYGTADGIRQKFTGYQKDEETQLDFAEARMYENRHARFTAVDPLFASGKSANPQTFNRYVYVINNPLAYTDPDGLQAGTPAKRTVDVFIIFSRKERRNNSDVNWNTLAKKENVNVHFIESGLAGDRVLKSLQTPNRSVVIITHSWGGSGEGIWLGEKKNGTLNGKQVLDVQSLGTDGLRTASYYETKDGLVPVLDTDGNRVESNQPVPEFKSENVIVLSCFPGYGFNKVLEIVMNPDSRVFYNNPTKSGGALLLRTGLEAGNTAAAALEKGLPIEDVINQTNAVLSTDPPEAGDDDKLQEVGTPLTIIDPNLRPKKKP